MFEALHDDIGHQGRDRTTSVLKQRFYWPGIDAYVKEKVQNCDRCIKRKAGQRNKAELVNITSMAPMEILCLYYLSLERSKSGVENILVITDHFTRYAQDIPTTNQTARTTAQVLFDNFVVHYGFPARFHSDQGQTFESKLIEELCKIAGTEQSRTTPYHPMGNGQCKHFNQTLLKMLGTLEEYQKSDRKSHVPSLVHADNATLHSSTGYSSYFLMFGRHPRLAIDAFLGLSPDALSCTDKTEYVRKLCERLHYADQKAKEETSKCSAQQKRYYDLNARSSLLYPGNRVLMRNVGLRGKQKLADRWESQPYVVCRQPNEDIPMYVVKPDNNRSRKTRTLHRNLLLPFMSIFDWHTQEEDLLNAEEESQVNELDTDGESDVSSSVYDARIMSDADVSIDESVSLPLSPRNRVQQKSEQCMVTPIPDAPSPRPQCIRRKPTWMNSKDWVL